MNEITSSRYQEAGVDIDKGNAFISRIRQFTGATHTRGVLTDIGGFSGLFALGNHQLKDPVLVTSTDGVGTKLAVAQLCGRHDTIGIDLVAMCVNDVVVCGAKPLCFLDYFASASLDLEVAVDVVRGIAEGCKQAKCALIGGETAEMPGLYRSGDYDLAGFVVGLVDRDKIIDGSDIRVGNRIIGLASSGVHSNGFSLVRKICFEEQQLKVSDHIEALGETLGEALLRPTRIYVESIVTLIKHLSIRGMVHITGGGFYDNIPRVLPQGCKAVIHRGSWPVPPIFTFLQERGKVSETEMHRVFNMGIGMILMIDEKQTDDMLIELAARGEKAFVIGEVVHQHGDEERVELI
ncbi:MAG: phosphoribosylformylglycinamidine cyclo-ligase [Desulfobulbaceae bacterium A2]|nr:MAG: phosphoribosylformylglycinamidine cyclo-ligase [Desulfobulbaceae bacterium A2]